MPDCPTSVLCRRLACALGGATLACAACLANATDARVLDAADAALAADVAWLVDRRVLALPVGTWPLPVAMLRRAMDMRTEGEAHPADIAALSRLRAALARLDAPAMAALRVNSARHPALDGADTPRSRADLRLTLQPTLEPIAVRLRVGADTDPLWRLRSRLSLGGSYVAAAAGNALVSLGLLDRHWGPGVMTSPLLSDAAPPMPALIVRRLEERPPALPVLRHLGPWGYELSAAQLQDYRPRNANLLGMRLYSRPAPWIEFGVTRHIFWGGRGRPRTAKSLVNALLGRSNIDDPAARGTDPSNELAGFDLRLSRRIGERGVATAYAHLVGEDEAGHLPSHWLGLVGAQFKHALDDHRLEWTLEATDTETGRLFGAGDARGPAYRHNVYRDGYYHLGLPLGMHIGGGGRSISLGVAWVAPTGDALDRVSLVATAARVSEGGPDALNRAFGTPGRLAAASLRAHGALGAARWSLGLSLQRQAAGARAGAGIVGGIEWPLGWTGAGG